jgi:type II secretory pathway component GspD/PulD (secretin)
MNPTFVRRSLALAVLVFLGTAAAHAQAQRPQPAPQGAQPGAPAEAQRPPPDAAAAPAIPAGPPLPTVSLESLVDRVTRASKKSFLIDSRAAQQVFLGSIKPEDVNYPTLLAILRANGMAATTIEGRVNIVPLLEIRSLAVPLLQNDDSNIPADEWVSRVITTTKKETNGMVPVLRPLLPGAAHLSAMCGTCEPGAQLCTNCRQLIIVDRYANVQRITAIVRMLDQQ